jgi:hypothetical protein
MNNPNIIIPVDQANLLDVLTFDAGFNLAGLTFVFTFAII